MINHMRPPGKMRDGLIDLCRDITIRTNHESLRVLELGSYAGESTSMFLEHLNIQTLTCVDAWQPNHKYKPGEISEAEILFNKNVLPRTRVFTRFKMTTDEAFKIMKFSHRKWFHLIYIDADHRYEAVKKDIENYRQLLMDGGIIAGHDYTNKFPGVVDAVNETLRGVDQLFDDTSWIKFL